MERKKRLLITVLSCILVFGLVACNAQVPSTSDGTQEVGGNDAAVVGDNAEETKADHHLTILFTKGGFEQPPENDIIYQQLVKESGVSFTQIAPPNANYKEKVTAIMASGDLPDMVRLPSLTDVYYYQEQGALMPLDDFINAEKTPNYWNIVEGKPAIDAVTIDGKRWGMPTWWDPHKCNTVIRGDWLEKLGLDVPVTLEDYFNVAKAFQQNNMGGGAKTYAFGGRQFNYKDCYAVFDMFMGAYGVMKDYWYTDSDGNLKPYNTTSAMRDCLEYIAMLNKEGLIDPEWVTVNSEGAQREAMGKGNYGITQFWWTIEPKLEVDMKKTDPNVNWIRIAPPVGPEGKSGLRGISGMTQCFVVTKDCKDTEAVSKLVDYLHGDPGMYTSYIGVEDEHWARKDDGTPYVLEEAANRDAKWIQWYSMFELETPLLQVDMYLLQSRLDSYKWPLIMNDADLLLTESELKYSAQLHSLVAETYTNIINGTVPIEAFDKMVDEWYKQGGPEWEKELNEVYKSRNK